MKMLAPTPLSRMTIVSANVLTDPEPIWDVSKNYQINDRVIRNNFIYAAVADNSGVDPEIDDQTNWYPVHAISKYRAFDGSLTAATTGLGKIVYTVRPHLTCNALAFFGLKARKVRLEVPSQSFDKTYALVSYEKITNYWLWFFGSREARSEFIAEGIPIYAGHDLRITIDGSSVGEIVIGKAKTLGKSIVGGGIGFTDFSTKDRDTFGNLHVVQRGYADTVDFKFAVQLVALDDLKRAIASRRAKPTVFYSSVDTVDFGFLVYGLSNELAAPVNNSAISQASLHVKGLTRW